MKKFLMLALSLAMVLSLAACSQEDLGSLTTEEIDAYIAYTRMTQKMDDVSSLDMDFTAKASIDFSALLGMSMDMDISGTAQQIIHSEDSVDMYLEMQMGMFGETATVRTYYVDGVMYQDDGSSKIKYPMGIEEAIGSSFAPEVSDLQFAREAIVDMSLTDVSGGQLLSFTLNPAMADNMMGDMLEPMLGSFEEDGMSMEINITAVSYSITIGDDYTMKSMNTVLSMDMVMSMDLLPEPLTVPCDMDMTYTVKSVNSVDTITLPADADSYVMGAA